MKLEIEYHTEEEKVAYHKWFIEHGISYSWDHREFWVTNYLIIDLTEEDATAFKLRFRI